MTAPLPGQNAAPDPTFHVIGAGAWGTALAIMLASSGKTTHLVTRTAEKAVLLQSLRENPGALPSIRFPQSLTAHSFRQDTAWQESVRRDRHALIVLAVPAQATRETLQGLCPLLPAGQVLIITAKGLERRTHRLLTDIVHDEAPNLIPVVLSGPSFAHDVAAGLPTAVTLAAAQAPIADRVSAALQTPTFRPYASDDLIGVQLGGALKNVLAIAAGAVDGRGLGESAKAALITRGFAEMSRLSIACGARAETLAGLSGLGDLVLTCSTAGSRNYRFGYEIGRGAKPADLLQAGQPLAEGARTAAAALALSEVRRIDMPITRTVAAIIEDGLAMDDAIEALLSRPLKRE